MTYKPIDMQSRGVYLYESRHQDGDVVSEHYHRVHQVLFTLEGEGTLDLDGRRYRLSRDRSAFISPQCRHAIVSESKLTLLVLAFDTGLIPADTLDGLLEAGFQTSELFEANRFTGSEMRQLLRKMLFEQSRQEPFFEKAMTVYLMELLLFLARTKRQQQPPSDSNRLRAERIRAYLEMNYFERLKPDDFGDKLGITARYVNDIFKDQYGMTPMQYLTDLRINIAQQLLAKTDKEIVTIAFEVGYETLSTFYRNFKNIALMSPKLYRQTNHDEREKKENGSQNPTLWPSTFAHSPPT